jgi:hypothetical protein
VRPLRLLHLCRPTYDNLGERAAIAAVEPMFAQRGAAVVRTALDVWDGPVAAPLDDRITEINANYDLMMIGPGGFLGPRLIERVFNDASAWSRLKIPLCFNGVGVVASIGRPVWFGALDADSLVLRALAAATVVSVREPQSWLLASRAMGDRSVRLVMAGCPSIAFARAAPAAEKTHDLALDISFTHEVCRNHIAPLLELARRIGESGRSVLWVCHSHLDAQQAMGVNAKLGLSFDIVQPADAAAAGQAYGACRAALVTHFHAGVFCLANQVPFGFVGYDVKCWSLMSMLADEPHRYILPIDRLATMDLGVEVANILQRIEAASKPFAETARLLCAHFGRETDRFVDLVIAAARRP